MSSSHRAVKWELGFEFSFRRFILWPPHGTRKLGDKNSLLITFGNQSFLCSTISLYFTEIRKKAHWWEHSSSLGGYFWFGCNSPWPLIALLSPTHLGDAFLLGGDFRAVTQAIYHVVLCATYPTVTIVLTGITQLLLCDYWEIMLGILQWVHQ